jgi:four helix bundle protein
VGSEKRRVELHNKEQRIDIDERVYDFALRVIKLVRTLPKETTGREMGRQLLKSATSIAANIEEARGAFSKNDFTFKMNTAFKEARESNLWLRLIRDSGLVNTTRMARLVRESEEIRNILGASVRTAKKKSEV